MLGQQVGDGCVDWRGFAGFGGFVDAKECALHVADDEPAQGFWDPVWRAAIGEGELFEACGTARDHACQHLAGEVGGRDSLAGVAAGEGDL